MKSRVSTYTKGFSYVELLIVMVLASILITFSTSSVVHLTTNMPLTQAGDELAATLLHARQKAISTGYAAEIRFYNLPAKDDDFWVSVVQVAYQKADGSYESEAPIWLPADTGISRNPIFSSFFRSGDQVKMLIRGTAGSEFPAHKEAEFVGFRYHPDGSTGLPEDKWFFTITFHNGDELKEIPKNFYTIQIDPVLGQLQSFRP